MPGAVFRAAKKTEALWQCGVPVFFAQIDHGPSRANCMRSIHRKAYSLHLPPFAKDWRFSATITQKKPMPGAVFRAAKKTEALWQCGVPVFFAQIDHGPSRANCMRSIHRKAYSLHLPPFAKDWRFSATITQKKPMPGAVFRAAKKTEALWQCGVPVFFAFRRRSVGRGSPRHPRSNVGLKPDLRKTEALWQCGVPVFFAGR